jgi:hypothetical protein
MQKSLEILGRSARYFILKELVDIKEPTPSTKKNLSKSAHVPLNS